MKKIILLLAVIFMTSASSAFAHCDYECVAPYNMNNKFRTVTAAASGLNFFTEKKIESVLKKEILKIASAEDLKVDLESYSPKDLRNGIFKSMHMSGKNVVINDIHLTDLDLKTLCDFNYIQQAGSDIVFVEDLPMSFNMTITPGDLNKTMEHSRYAKLINSMNKILSSYVKGVTIASTKVSIKNNKFYYVLGFSIPFIHSEQKLVFQSDLCIKKGKINLSNTKIASGSFNLDLNKADFLLNYLNPLDFSVNILKNKDAKVKVENLSVVSNVIKADGYIVIPKDER